MLSCISVHGREGHLWTAVLGDGAIEMVAGNSLDHIQARGVSGAALCLLPATEDKSSQSSPGLLPQKPWLVPLDSGFHKYRAKAAPRLLEGCQRFTVYNCFHAMTTEFSNRDRTAPRKVWSVYCLAFPENGCQPSAVTEQSAVTSLSSSLTI